MAAFDYTQLYNESVEMATAKTCEALKNPNIFCVITRSKNQNVVVYEANVKDGAFPEKGDVLQVYWLDIDPEYVKKNRAKGKTDDREELIWMEKKIAYGAHAHARPEPGTYEVHFVALPKQHAVLKMDPATKRPRLYAEVNGKTVMLKQMYVHAEEGLLKPKVLYVMLICMDADGKEFTHKVVP
eukprot:RCo039883